MPPVTTNRNQAEAHTDEGHDQPAIRKWHDPYRGGEYSSLETQPDESLSSLHDGLEGDYQGERILTIVWFSLNHNCHKEFRDDFFI
jgi:hypothetical protein